MKQLETYGRKQQPFQAEKKYSGNVNYIQPDNLKYSSKHIFYPAVSVAINTITPNTRTSVIIMG
ncbi:MAG: hypothetical protein ACE5GM_10765, partial [bacterium]